MKCIHVSFDHKNNEKITYESDSVERMIAYHEIQCYIHSIGGTMPRNTVYGEWRETGSDNPEMRWEKTFSVEAWTTGEVPSLKTTLTANYYASEEEYHQQEFASKVNNN